MLIVLSPAKRMDFESELPRVTPTTPEFLDDAEQLVRKLRRFSKPKLRELMSINADLAALNKQRFAEWSPSPDAESARPAIFAFQGDVYRGLDAGQFGTADLKFAQKHVRILSGLYGVLRPLDLIQPYRLEMGTKLSTRRGKDLYEFWGDRIREEVEGALASDGSGVLVNLASNEYFKALQPRAFDGRIVTPVFKQKKGDTYRVQGMFAKPARGAMTAFAVRERLEDPEGLKAFDEDGYRFAESLSTTNEWVFVRD